MKTVYAVMWSEKQPREEADSGLSKVYSSEEKAKNGMIEGAFSDLLSYYDGADEEEPPFDYWKGVKGGYSIDEKKEILSKDEYSSMREKAIEIYLGADYKRWIEEVEIE